MYGELMSDEQGGREYENIYEQTRKELREQWLEETNGEISFDDWLDEEE